MQKKIQILKAQQAKAKCGAARKRGAFAFARRRAEDNIKEEKLHGKILKYYKKCHFRILLKIHFLIRYHVCLIILKSRVLYLNLWSKH